MSGGWRAQEAAVVAWLQGLGASDAALAAFSRRSGRTPIDVTNAEANRLLLMEVLHMSSRQVRPTHALAACLPGVITL